MAFVEHKMSISFPPVYYFYLFISLLVAFKDTVSCFLCTYCPVCEPTVHAECSLKANSQWDNKRLRVRIWGVPKQTSTTLHPPSSFKVPPPRPSLLCPVHANLTKAQPALYKMLVYQLSLPHLSEKVITTAKLYVCISISVSAISIHTSTQTHFFFLSFLLYVFPPSFKVKWSEHPFCIVSLGAKELRAFPKCQIYNSALLGHVASGHVSASLLTLFSPEPLFLRQTEKIHLQKPCGISDRRGLWKPVINHREGG